MSERASIFEGIDDLSDFAPKPAPKIAKEDARRAGERLGFADRGGQTPTAPSVVVAVAAKTEQRRYRTGRNVQLSVKVDAETQERFNRLADDTGLVLGQVLKMAIEALERERAQNR